MPIRTFQGAVAFITGGASGIGKAFGEELARRGADVVLTDINEALAREAAEGIVRRGGKASAIKHDVRDVDATERIVDDVVKEKGRLDYVFANAGTGVFGEVHLLEKKHWDIVVDVNLHGVINTVRAAYPRLVKQGFGHLVNTASMAGLVAVPFLATYAMTKHAVVGLSKSMRIEAARHGVRVSALCPSAIRTPILTGGEQGGAIYPGLTEERKLEWWKRIGPITELAPFTKDAIDAIARNENVIVLPKRNRALLAMLAMMPAALEEKVTRTMYERTLRDFPEIRSAGA